MDKNVTLATSTASATGSTKAGSKAVGLWVVVRAADLKRIVDQVSGLGHSGASLAAAQAELEGQGVVTLTDKSFAHIALLREGSLGLDAYRRASSLLADRLVATVPSVRGKKAKGKAEKADSGSLGPIAAIFAVETGAKDEVHEAAAVGACIEGLALRWFEFVDFRGSANPKRARPKLKLKLSNAADAATRAAGRKALIMAGAANVGRHLAATPPNVANPAYLARFCRKAAGAGGAKATSGLKCRIINAEQAEKLGMGGLLAVGAGGSTPPCMIELSYTPRPSKARGSKTSKAGSKKTTAAPVLIVGKAITFDTGGYSIKPKGGPGMKYDKCGGMNVIGAMLAIAELKPKVPVVALIAAAENMIDSTAYRPDDIITFCNGVTCEITNTDAEGRLVMADGLAWGTKTFKPRAVIDMATLTGGVGVALGPYSGGLWCHDEELKEALYQAADVTGERLWELPLWPEHRAMMRADHADLHNSAPVRFCHATQGAAFLSYFVGEDAPTKMPSIPWAHLDIAAVATSDGSGTQPLYPKGPTGFGVRLVAELINSMK